MVTKNIAIKTEYITLGALLKYTNIIQQGSEAILFLQDNSVLVNGELENRRGRKIYPNYSVQINDDHYFIVLEGKDNGK